MSNVLTFISRSLAAKLIIALVSLIIIGGGISWYTLIRTGRQNLINEAVKDAASSSELVKKSVRYGMLTFNREAIQQTIDDLGSAKDVKIVGDDVVGGVVLGFGGELAGNVKRHRIRPVLADDVLKFSGNLLQGGLKPDRLERAGAVGANVRPRQPIGRGQNLADLGALGTDAAQ